MSQSHDIDRSVSTCKSVSNNKRVRAKSVESRVCVGGSVNNEKSRVCVNQSAKRRKCNDGHVVHLHVHVHLND